MYLGFICDLCIKNIVRSTQSEKFVSIRQFASVGEIKKFWRLHFGLLF